MTSLQKRKLESLIFSDVQSYEMYSLSTSLSLSLRMVATLTKIGEGAFADVFGCQKEGWKKLAIKVHAHCVYYGHVTMY